MIASEKCRKAIQCPKIVKVYNRGMDGVDLSDMLIALYRIEVKTRRWYLNLFWHCIDICKVNAWLLYRRPSDALEIYNTKKKTAELIEVLDRNCRRPDQG